MGCSVAAPIEYVYITPDVPEATRTPCVREPRDISTWRNLAIAYVEAVQSDDCNRGKVIAMDEILDAAEGLTDRERRRGSGA